MAKQKARILPGAEADIMARAGATFELDDDGEPIAREGQYGEDGRAITFDGFAQGLAQSAPHLFESPEGGGSKGGGGAGGRRAGRTIPRSRMHTMTGEDLADIASGKATIAEGE